MSGYSDVILAETNLVSYWRLGEASGTLVDEKGLNSSTGSGAGTTFGAASLLPNDTNTCLRFNGTSGWVKCADSASLDIVTALSIECWILLEAVPGAQANLVTKYDATNNGGYEIAMRTDRTLRFDVRGGGATTLTNSVGAVPVGVRTHLVATYDDATNTGKWYLNGVLDNTDTGMTTVLAGNTGLFSMGARSSNGVVDPDQLFFPGRMDEVAVYGTSVLTLAQVTAHYQAALSAQTIQRPVVSGLRW